MPRLLLYSAGNGLQVWNLALRASYWWTNLASLKDDLQLSTHGWDLGDLSFFSASALTSPPQEKEAKPPNCVSPGRPLFHWLEGRFQHSAEPFFNCTFLRFPLLKWRDLEMARKECQTGKGSLQWRASLVYSVVYACNVDVFMWANCTGLLADNGEKGISLDLGRFIWWF